MQISSGFLDQENPGGDFGIIRTLNLINHVLLKILEIANSSYDISKVISMILM